MKLIEVTYPFEVDEECGGYGVLYGSLAEAREDARRLYLERADELERAQRAPAGPAQVSRVEVRSLTKAAVVDILNSRGGRWQSSEVRIGEFVWAGGRLTLRRGSARTAPEAPPRR